MDNRTHAQKRRAEAQEALRMKIEAGGYLQAINADLERDIASDEVAVVRFKTETRLKLLSKILPDLTESKADIAIAGTLTGILAGLGASKSNDPPMA